MSLRAIVNLDTFLKWESPEQLWTDYDFDKTVTADDGETPDIFGPAMENLFDTGKLVIDAALAGAL